MTKDMLIALLSHPIAFHPALARLAGSAAAGLWLSQLIYWTGRGRLDDGWIYKTAAEWESETCLSCAEQRTARARWRALAVVNERQQGLDRTLYYQVDFDRLAELLQLQSTGGGTPVSSISAANPHGYPTSRINKCKVDNQQMQEQESAVHCTQSTASTFTATAGLRGRGTAAPPQLLAGVQVWPAVQDDAIIVWQLIDAHGTDVVAAEAATLTDKLGRPPLRSEIQRRFAVISARDKRQAARDAAQRAALEERGTPASPEAAAAALARARRALKGA